MPEQSKSFNFEKGRGFMRRLQEGWLPHPLAAPWPLCAPYLVVGPEGQYAGVRFSNQACAEATAAFLSMFRRPYSVQFAKPGAVEQENEHAG